MRFTTAFGLEFRQAREGLAHLVLNQRAPRPFRRARAHGVRVPVSPARGFGLGSCRASRVIVAARSTSTAPAMAATAVRPDDRHLETFLGECVRESLDSHQVANAVFLCERLHASFPNEHNTYLLATCYHRFGQPHRARAVLRGQTSDRCLYLLALCCYALNRLPEAERALVGVGGGGGGGVGGRPSAGRENQPPPKGKGTTGKNERTAKEPPNGAAGLYLLGMVMKETGRRAGAVVNFKKALAMDPFNWSSREELCGLGAESEAREAEGSFFAAQNQREANDGNRTETGGYPSLDELGGFVEVDAEFARRFGNAGAVPFSFGKTTSGPMSSFSTGGTHKGASTAQRPFQFRARPQVPDSAAPSTQTPAPQVRPWAFPKSQHCLLPLFECTTRDVCSIASASNNIPVLETLTNISQVHCLPIQHTHTPYIAQTGLTLFFYTYRCSRA